MEFKGLLAAEANTVTLHSTGSVTESGDGAITTTTDLFLSGDKGDFTLNGKNNVGILNIISTPTVTTGSVSYTDVDALILGTSTLTGNLNLTTMGGELSQTGALSVNGTGTTTLTAGEKDITLTNATNNFTGAVSVKSGGDVSLTNTNALATVFNNINIGGKLVLISTGAVSQQSYVAPGKDELGSGALSITGTTSLTADTKNITLANATNDFTGAISVVSGGNLELTNNNAIATILDNVSVGGNLTLVSTGAVSQVLPASVIAVTGTTSLKAGEKLPTVVNSNSSRNFALVLTGADIPTTSEKDITLTNAANNFKGAVSVVLGANVQLTNKIATILNDVNVAGNLALISTGEVSQQTGVISIAGTTTLKAGTTGDAKNITLANATNDFTGAISVVSDENVSLTNATATILDNVNVGGNLALISTGAVSQESYVAPSKNKLGYDVLGSGALNITGTTSLTAGTKDITLTNAANNFTGAISVVSLASDSLNNPNEKTSDDTANVSLTNATATILDNINVSGKLALISTGVISQQSYVAPGDGVLGSGVLIVKGATSLTANEKDITSTTETVEGSDGNSAIVLKAAASQSGEPATSTVGEKDITLKNAANDFTGAVSVVLGKNVSLVDVNALEFGTSAMTGNLNVATKGIISQTGALTVKGTTSLTADTNAIMLRTAANNFTGAISVVSNANISLTNDIATILDNVNVGGSLTLISTGAVTQQNYVAPGDGVLGNGVLIVTGTTSLMAGKKDAPLTNKDITLTNATNNFTGAISVESGANVSLVDGNTIEFGKSAITGDLKVTANGIISQSGAVAVTGKTSLTAGQKDIKLTDVANNFTGAVSVVSGTNVSLTNAIATVLDVFNVSNNLALVSTGAVTQTGTLSIGGTTSFTTGTNNLTFTDAANNFAGLVSVVSGGNISLTNVKGIEFGKLAMTGDLTVVAKGVISQTGAFSIGGATSLTAGANAITLTDAANDFTGAVSVVSGGKVSLVDVNAIELGKSAITGNLIVDAKGISSKTGAISVTGTTNLTAGKNDIALTDAANNFTGEVSVVSGDNVSLTNAIATVLNVFNVGNNLAIVSTGAVSQTGILSISGTTSLTTGTNDITFTNAANDFKGAVSVVSGGKVSLVDVNAIEFGTSAITGDLIVDAKGISSKTGALAVTGTTNLTAGKNDITLTDAANKFTGEVFVVSGDNVSLTNAMATVLNVFNVGKDFTLVSTGAVSQTDALLIGGKTSLTTGTNDITFTNVANKFTGEISVVSAGNVSLVNMKAIEFGTSAMTGNLDVTTSGVISQTGAMSVGGTTTLTADKNDITLTDAANKFTGDFSVVSGANVSLTNAMATILKDVNVGKDFALVATGAVSQTGILSIGGTTSLTAGTNDITLTDEKNDFTGEVSVVSGGNVSLTNSKAFTLGASTVSGDLAVEAFTGDLTVTSNLSAGDSDISLTTDALFLAAGASIQSTGALLIQPKTLETTIGIAGGAGMLEISASYFATNFADGFSNITIGRDDGTGKITIGALSLIDNLTLLNTTGGIEVTGLLEAGENIFTLNSAGSVTQSAPITATNLSLSGSGNYTLDDSSNKISALSADGIGSLNFVNSDAFSIGEKGIVNATGEISLATITGDLTLAQNVITSGKSIMFNAGSSTEAGTSTGGNIVISGAPTITAGRVTFYSGEAVNSSLANYIPAGHFRYNNVAIADSNATGNYAIYREKPTLLITPNPATSVYGDPIAKFSGEVSTTNSINGDTWSVMNVTGTPVFDTTVNASNHVGKYNVDYVSGYSSAIGYDFVDDITSKDEYSITARTLTPTLTNTGVTKIYDGNVTAPVGFTPAYSYSNFATGDSAADLSFSTAVYNSKNVTTATEITVSDLVLNSITGTGAITDYVLDATSKSVAAGITPAALNITATGITKIYDGLTTAQVNLMGNPIGDDNVILSNSVADFADKNAGTAKPIAVSGITVDGTDAGNYTFNTSAETSADITPAPLTVAADAQTKIYGDADPVFSYTATGFKLTDNESVLIGSLTRAEGETVASYAISGDFFVNPNYAITFTPANLAITPAALTIAADAQTKIYGDADPVLSYKATGFKLTDSESVLTGSLTRAEGETVANYAISGGFVNPNYAITYTPADLAITPAALTIAADAQ
ncbi:MAG: MBG domain-containing protein, partial [Methylococcaceae bacterium]